MKLQLVIFQLMVTLMFFSGYAKTQPLNDVKTFTNPVLIDGADPYAYYHTDGYYYFMATRGNRLDIWRTRDITQLAVTTSKTAWQAPSDGPNSCSIWAPEIHYIQNKWYIYYSGSDRKNDTDAARHIFVLENTSPNPMEGEWVNKGALKTNYNGIDGSVFELDGKLYFLYSAYVQNHSDVMLAEMDNPWTLKLPEVDLASPNYTWERSGDRSILEGPIFLSGPSDNLFIVFSASACWDDHYALGMLTASRKSNLLEPLSWSRTVSPVFAMSEKNQVFGPGHNGFFKSPDGKEDWIIYHGKDKPGLGCSKRSCRIQKFTWKTDGTPDFAEPVPTGFPINKPSGI